MLKVQQLYQCTVPGEVFGEWTIQGGLFIFSPHPEVQTVMFSNMTLETGSYIPYHIEYLMNYIVQDFQLDPELLIWIEHYSRYYAESFLTHSATNCFLLGCKWRNGFAIRPQRTPIDTQLVNTLTGNACFESDIYLAA